MPLTARRHALRLLATLPALALPGLAVAAGPQMRIGTLAPKNSLYHRQLLEIGEAWRAAQGEGAKFTVYPDGSQGGETDMARRMRIGQLQGALLSVVGLREIEPSISALQNMPLMFRSWDEVDYVREKIRPAMEKKFLDKGFVVLTWGDAGWVRFFSKEAAVRPDDYKKMKFFAWAGESEQQDIMKSLGYTPVPLETSDILPSIQTGMINAVPSTPYFALASQVYATANHMLDINWAPIVGALVVTKKAWDDMTPAAQTALRDAAAKAGAQMRQQARKEVDEAVEAMKKRGLVVHTPTPEQMKEWNDLADKLYPRIRGKMVPADTFDEVVSLLKTYRAGKR
ncbi:MAG TPA: TRAP transporter substrate-binding protein DctP [Zoogloea sp.]|uniref:TRAP transporter substrate-binding protein n=1 Tax=Zoogloea sp. TaxID=49181 RepID=UPI002C8CF7CD|nr:TRAP transporter substrate-binding protein DctP [Zoogloea sp.]HMV18126.1 TRAP transporter substrate-binding protein DctP [Rhodocyclaceae bacterium]HMV62275.1 TRAP transporter substrate-binding protein DctP [Rhodocyclaceae bacterium]HMW50752.1 TRAP transporter substrate-binding protein DctP [Rhodocyclaceae bacterium]HMZ75990.1 TRAP transporter substrate-binding protein DctP [Rhodocyclaceae bacterium]HNA66323.1 TRAP transporter substrate-binding protein DctP [Rhodocyclaceae bacterium]